MIHNLQTEHVSPQWHVVCDELFKTVQSAERDDEELKASSNQLFLENRECCEEDNLIGLEADEPPQAEEDWLPD